MSEPQRLAFRCDDAGGFEFRVLRAPDGDFHLSVVPCQQDMDVDRRVNEFGACYGASVRVRMPMIGGGSHEPLYRALAKLFRAMSS